jgi:carbon-monoxide dehydrogenase large subunit
VSVVGSSVGRARDADLLTGRGRFVADVDRPGQLYARVLRSPLARATLGGVNAEAALARDGVVAVVTAQDVPDVRIPVRTVFAATPNTERVLQPLLARDVVRYVGEPVAVVVAEDPWLAEDAAELVELDLEYASDGVATDPVTAAEDGAPLVHPELGTNVVDVLPMMFGDVERAFAEADVVVRKRLVVGRHTGVPLETRGLVAEHDPATGRLTVWGAAKVKHFNRAATATLLGLDPASVRLVEVDVGGGFGVRGELYPEDVLVPFLALTLGRPVKWIEDRAEHLVAANHSREQVHEIAVAARSDGTLLAFEDRLWCDLGAYARTHGVLPAMLPGSHLPGPYVWKAFSVTAHAVLTNRTPVGTYRGPGMTEATFVRERMLDLVAGELGMDPVELRRRNLVPAERMPFTYELGPDTPPLVYGSGDFPAYFERLLREADVDGLRGLRALSAGVRERIGVGVSALVELGGIGPFEEASIEALHDGSVVVRAGVGSLGQGIETALAQIAADGLGVAMSRVTVQHHDTDDVASGFGSFASRSTVVAGNAVALAARALLERAGEALGTDAASVDAERDFGTLVEIGEVHGRFDKEHASFSFGAAVSVVAVDEETGRVRPLRHVVAHDVGRAVNPAIVHGQLAGGAAQGIGGALLEELPYDEDGNPLALSLADYAMPTLAEVPPIDTIAIESAVLDNPLGLKGAGEGGVASAPAAVANAVADALGRAGGRVEQLPLTPPRVRGMLRDEEATTEDEGR